MSWCAIGTCNVLCLVIFLAASSSNSQLSYAEYIQTICRYEFRLRITLGPGGDLMLTSRIRNTNIDGKSFTFTFAYHTYFHVTDIRFFDKIYLLLLSLELFF
jgi:D-hexose-6-phosphate mutarotase